MADRQPQGHFHRNRLRIVIDIDRKDFERIAAADIPGCRPGVMAPRIRTIIQLGLEALQSGEKDA